VGKLPRSEELLSTTALGSTKYNLPQSLSQARSRLEDAERVEPASYLNFGEGYPFEEVSGAGSYARMHSPSPSVIDTLILYAATLPVTLTARIQQNPKLVQNQGIDKSIF
jgi:hypothetical protein